jgi:4-aminobutyrate aminotransferase-like enzyme
MNIVRAGTSANCFRMAPPLTIAEEEIDLAVEIIDASLRAVLASGVALAGEARLSP